MVVKAGYCLVLLEVRPLKVIVDILGKTDKPAWTFFDKMEALVIYADPCELDYYGKFADPCIKHI